MEDKQGCPTSAIGLMGSWNAQNIRKVKMQLAVWNLRCKDKKGFLFSMVYELFLRKFANVFSKNHNISNLPKNSALLRWLIGTAQVPSSTIYSDRSTFEMSRMFTA